MDSTAHPGDDVPSVGFPHGEQCPRHSLAALLGFVPALAMRACSGPSLLIAAEAGPRYQQLSTDISETLASEYPGLDWAPLEGRQTRMAENSDGECILTVGTLRSPEALTDLAGGWKPVVNTIVSALEDAGFESMNDEDTIPGGWTGISSRDDHGGKIRIYEKSFSEITVSAQVSDTVCPTDLDKVGIARASPSARVGHGVLRQFCRLHASRTAQ